MYNKKLLEYKEKQYNLLAKIEELRKNDKNFYLTVSHVLDLSNHALEIFESSEINEKRSLVDLLLKNPQLSGRKLCFTLRSPLLVKSKGSKVLNLVEHSRRVSQLLYE